MDKLNRSIEQQIIANQMTIMKALNLQHKAHVPEAERRVVDKLDECIWQSGFYVGDDNC